MSLQDFADSLIVDNDPDDIPGICPTCLTAMVINGADYHCSGCGRIAAGAVEERRDRDITNAPVRRATGVHRGRVYNPTTNYAASQKKAVLEQLHKHRREYTGDAIPDNVLNKVAEIYNSIQRGHTDGNGGERFVRRGVVKDEILAFLIQKVCDSEGIARQNQEIAKFMGLTTQGYARGERIITALVATKRLILPQPADEVRSFAECFAEKMEIDNANYISFIVDIVKHSEALMLKLDCRIVSKVAGAVYLLARAEGLPYKQADIEKVTQVKKNTFMKFYNAVAENRIGFIDIYAKYGIKT